LNVKRYPHLVDPLSYASSRLGISGGLEVLAGEEHLVSLALRRLKLALEGGLPEELSPSADDEVFSFWLLLLALKASNSVYVLGRILDAEVERVERFLKAEDVESLASIARVLGVRVEFKPISFPWLVIKGRVSERPLEVAVPVEDFLRYASRSKLEELRLVNNFVKGGYVYMDKERLVKLLSEASRLYIVEKLKAMEAPENPVFQRLVEEVRKLEALEASGFREELLPSCVRGIIASSKARRLSDEEAYVVLSLLSSIGAPVEYVERLLVEMGLASVKEARVIAEALLKVRGYTPFKCEELKSRGICECSEDLVREYQARLRSLRGRGRA